MPVMLKVCQLPLGVLSLCTFACTLQGTAPPAFNPPATKATEPADTVNLRPPTVPPASAGFSGSPTPSPLASKHDAPGPTIGSTPTPSPTARGQTRRKGYWGMVFDEEGGIVDGATVRLRSLETEPDYKYEATTTAAGGAWEFRDAPIDIRVEIQASLPGWTSRRVINAPPPTPTRDIEVSFGQPDEVNPALAGEAGIFLSNYPEIESVEPASGNFEVDPDDTIVAVDPSNVTLNLKFSEPFDQETRQRIAQAVRLWPADSTSGNADAVDLSQFTDKDEGDGLADLLLSFPPGDASPATRDAIHAAEGGRASAVWDTEGRILTFAVNGVIGASDRVASYQVGLVSDGKRFTDADGHALGTDDSGGRETATPAYQLLANVFSRRWSVLRVLWQPPGSRPITGNQRLNATHDATFKFRTRVIR